MDWNGLVAYSVKYSLVVGMDHIAQNETFDMYINDPNIQRMYLINRVGRFKYFSLEDGVILVT